MSKIVTDDVLKELIAKLKTLINSKASSTDLESKADATHTHDWDDIPNLEVSLSGKATVSYVNDKLALKADVSYVDEKLANIGDTAVTYEDCDLECSDDDERGIYRIVTYKRQDGSTYMTSTLSNPDTNGDYRTCTWNFYDTGNNLTETKVWTITYDSNNTIVSANLN